MPEELKPYEFEKGKSGNPNGRPKGSRNRSTIARKWLEVCTKVTNPITGDEESLSLEDQMTIVQIIKAIQDKDTVAYKNIMDSAHGAPTQHNSIDANITSEDVTPIMFTKTKPIDKAE